MTPEPKAETPTVVDDASVEEGVDELEGSEDYSGDRDDSVEPEPTARKAKRARSSAAKPKAPRKKYVRGKQGGLQGIMKMPLEIFTEIAYHITPGDLIVLVRCNKFFRNMLLRRSAMLIWQHAAQNVPGLPPCPTGMCEPQYAALMFSKSCTLCGATATAKPDPFLQVRLCSTCRDTKLEARGANDYMYPGLVSRSHVIKGKAVVVTDAELEEVRKKSEELLRSKDRGAYGRWSEEKRQDVILRFKDASVLQEYIVSANKYHGYELANMKKERRDMICEHLKALGWTDADQQFSSSYAKAWNSLVDIAKPLTDRTWTNLLPKLTPLLEENRARRLRSERMDRRTQRRRRLHELLSDIKDTENRFGAAIDVLTSELESAVPPAPGPLYSLSLSAHVQRRGPVVKNPFPPTATVLEWECVKDLGESEIELERVENLFKERRGQFDRCLADWRAGLEEQLVGIFEAGAEDIVPGVPVQPVEGESRTEPIVKVKNSTDSTKALSRNMRLLLRADTIFKEIPSESNRYDDPFYYGERVKPIPHLRYYPDIIAPYDSFYEASGWPSSPGPEVNVDQYLRYSEAETLVKKMLLNMRIPDVARMELDAMKARFACGRCNEQSAMTWDQMVYHYMNRQRQWEKESTQKGKHSTIHPVVFRNIHDPEWTSTPKPLVRVLTVEEASKMNYLSYVATDRVRCMLCLSTGRHYTGPLEDAKVHLQDVHDVAEPTEGLYYRSDRDRYHTLVSELMSDEWHKEWDEFHDALAISVSVSAVDPLAIDSLSHPHLLVDPMFPDPSLL